MATVAAPALDERAFVPVPPALRELGFVAQEPVESLSPLGWERSEYRPARANPVALIASAAMILGMGACLATLNIVAAHKERMRLTAVELEELEVTPPPPPPEPTKLETPQAAVTQTVAPKPMIELPSPGPQQVMVDAPPPPAPPTFVSEGVKPAAAPAVAPAPASTMEGGDLSSKVLFAKPPTYPVDARRAHEQGTVKLLLLVGSDGTVKDIKVASSSGSSRLDGAALRAVKHWRWSPTMSNGVATAVRGYVTIPFVLTTA
ncbi:energy transducer TonB [Novosphingobium kaempferiae]|uniref:energy transducer TonB n=1 Tax=Novosphingobium kaempferiae TaxID=2896849 RepID=UPI001E4E1065|nr:energy transducer TonB [Novosphingobium kaempferiae]